MTCIETVAVKNFREYLRIPSVHPDVDYTECVKFFKRLAKENDLKFEVKGSDKKPVVILTWNGSHQPAKIGSLMFSSHMDVVPVVKEQWLFDPFEAVKDEHGNIYGRGAQDTKQTAIQYIAAVKRLKDKGVVPKRNVHLVFVPDEEIGGFEGMGEFVKSDYFKQLNVVCVVDEGCASATETFNLFNDERCKIGLKIHCTGPTGHGSLLHEGTAGEKLNYVLNELMDFREKQVKELNKAENKMVKQAEVTTINLTQLEGGIQNNVVPPEFILHFDIRLSIYENHEEFYEWIENICKAAGQGVYTDYIIKPFKVQKTLTDDTNPYWMAFKQAMDKMNLKVKVIPCFGTSDARFLREVGLPVLGFSPMRNTEMRLHCNNEMLNESIFLEGIDVFTNVIEALINV